MGAGRHRCVANCFRAFHTARSPGPDPEAMCDGASTVMACPKFRQMLRHARVVAFDLDDTLWSCCSAMGRARAAFWAHIEERYPTISARYDPDAFHAAMKRLMREEPEIAHDFTALRKRVTRDMAAECGLDGDTVAMSSHTAFMQGRNDVDLFPGVESALDRLRRAGVVVGAVTNGNAEVERIAAVAGRMDFIVRASAVGAAKPAPAFFAALLQAAREACSDPLLPPDRVVVVGDSLSHDILGANRAGMPCVWAEGTVGPWSGCLTAKEGEEVGERGGLRVAATVQSAAEVPDLLLGAGGEAQCS